MGRAQDEQGHLAADEWQEPPTTRKPALIPEPFADTGVLPNGSWLGTAGLLRAASVLFIASFSAFLSWFLTHAWALNWQTSQGLKSEGFVFRRDAKHCEQFLKNKTRSQVRTESLRLLEKGVWVVLTSLGLGFYFRSMRCYKLAIHDPRLHMDVMGDGVHCTGLPHFSSCQCLMIGRLHNSRFSFSLENVGPNSPLGTFSTQGPVHRFLLNSLLSYFRAASPFRSLAWCV